MNWKPKIKQAKSKRPMATPLHTKGISKVGSASRRSSLLVIVAGICIGLFLLAGGYAVWKAVPEMPVRELSFKGTMQHTSKDELARLAQNAQGIQGDVWRIDLEQFRADVKRLPWVRDAAVRRVFPDRIEVTVEEHAPVAYWLEHTGATIKENRGRVDALVNTYAEVFRADYKEPLPVWSGPSGSAADVMQQHARYVEILAPSGATPIEVRLSARRAWQVKLDNGVILELGRADTEARLGRFVRAQQKAPALQVADLHADLRYANGLAVRNSAELAPIHSNNAARR